MSSSRVPSTFASLSDRFPAIRRMVGVWPVALEIGLIFGIIVLYGLWPVPDVNEQYYVGKAIHFWNADYFPNDPFLDAPDSHWFYCATFGLFSKIFSPVPLVWFGRVLVWFLTAWGWQRFSSAFVSRWGAAVVSAAIFFFLLENFHLAGEWIAGGVEGKGLAFPFVFFGLAAWVRGDFNRAFFLLGLASAFHVLVGGWVVLATFLAALFVSIPPRRPFPQLKSFLPGLFVGGVVSLLGLIPALALDMGTSASVAREAHRIYVFERLSHHLVPSSLPWTFLVRFGLLTVLWVLGVRCWSLANAARVGESREDAALLWGRRWNRFVWGAILIAAVGFLVDYGAIFAAGRGWISDRQVAAELLRFYLFRLSDWVVPAGVAIGSVTAIFSFPSGKNWIGSSKGDLWPWLLGLIGGVALFIGFKFGFRLLANHLAIGQTTDPAWPTLPRPVDAVAFLAALCSLGVLGAIWRLAVKGAPVKTMSGGPIPLLATILFGASIFGAAEMIRTKTDPMIPRSAPPKQSIADGWLDVCRWAKEETPTDAVFLVPRGCDSLKWNAKRADVGSWKEIPQDARSIVAWYRKMVDLYTPLDEETPNRWNQPLVAILLNKGYGRFVKLSEKYGFDYIVAEQPPWTLSAYPTAQKRYDEFVKKGEVYRNAQFVVFKIGDEKKINSDGQKKD